MIEKNFLGWGATMLVAITLFGCSKPADNKPQQSAAPAAELTPDQVAAYAELPEAERTVAEKQAICPVSDHKLGTMGKPYKVTVKDKDGKDHDIYLCCEGCKEDVEKEPEKFIAKLTK